MRRFFKRLLILILLGCLGFTIFKLNLIPALSKTVNKTFNKNAEIKRLEENLNKYQQKEKNREAEEERLKNIQVTNTINSEIRKTVKLQLLEGDKVHQVAQRKDALISWCDNTLYIELPYTYSIMINAERIKVIKVKNKTVYYEIVSTDGYEIYLQLHANKIKMTTDNKLITVGFNEKDMDFILKQAEKDIIEQIQNDEELYYEAQASLEDYLHRLSECYGYKTVIEYK